MVGINVKDIAGGVFGNDAVVALKRLGSCQQEKYFTNERLHGDAIVNISPGERLRIARPQIKTPIGTAIEVDFVAGIGPVAAIEIIQRDAAQFEQEGAGSIAIDLN